MVYLKVNNDSVWHDTSGDTKTTGWFRWVHKGMGRFQTRLWLFL